MSAIEAREKLTEAKYFLDQMMRLDFMGLNTGIFKDREFGYNLDGFLVAWHSVLDVLRYDFAEKFSLGITRQERVPHRNYLKHLADALAGKNPREFSEAAAFYEWMNRQEDELLKRHSLLLEKRHIVVHRGTVKTGVKEDLTEWAVNVSASGSSTYGVSTYGTGVYLDPASLVSSLSRSQPLTIQAGSIPEPPAAAEAPRVGGKTTPTPLVRSVRIHESRAYTFFKDDPEERSIVSICGSAYENMARFLDDAEKGSWKTTSTGGGK